LACALGIYQLHYPGFKPWVIYAAQLLAG